ncbi:D-tyrosyl-tRNA(Tyr) deacylase [Fodinisporobacter ferrooxydans]|uniref:D-aminoacyl-tRNA deacylase n=1 Tax=Fodinisporobacter ferrooxydans TaxID=2901836 RepID=A0ABY4CGL6_9BACL|nr:D-tyrosyl-tRNA(Tyr) deacylase [Alicyclobacillaceae bacterium MYW30-H2]
MRVVVQRVRYGRVRVEDRIVGEIKSGFVLLVGVTHEDTEQDAVYLAEKIVGLRVFEDGNQKMNLGILEAGGSILSISQFTLYGDCRKGRRPNFMDAARPEQALRIYERLNQEFERLGVTVETGAFGAMMDVELANDGPVTLLLDSKRVF